VVRSRQISFQYDALGRRVSKTAGSSTTVYVCKTEPIAYGPFAGQVIRKYAGGTAPASPSERYIYGTYIDAPIWKTGTVGAVYYHANNLYCVSALTDGTGAVAERYQYSPYGVLTILAADGTTVRTVSSYANPYTFTGRRWDGEALLYYYRARYYDPLAGRFVGRDPIGYSARNSLFAYSNDSPSNTTDRTGLAEEQAEHCGTFSLCYKSVPARDVRIPSPKAFHPGYIVEFDPSGCEKICRRGRVKLVQAINLGSWFTGIPSQFDGLGRWDDGKKLPPGTQYPGYCDSGGKGCSGFIDVYPGKHPPRYGDAHIIDAPDGGSRGNGIWTMTVCAVVVCDSCGAESILGCINFRWYNYPDDDENPKDETFETIDPSDHQTAAPPRGMHTYRWGSAW